MSVLRAALGHRVAASEAPPSVPEECAEKHLHPFLAPHHVGLHGLRQVDFAQHMSIFASLQEEDAAAAAPVPVTLSLSKFRPAEEAGEQQSLLGTALERSRGILSL
jgi:hypothetical protein